jgi:hypothetical protein
MNSSAFLEPVLFKRLPRCWLSGSHTSRKSGVAPRHQQAARVWVFGDAVLPPSTTRYPSFKFVSEQNISKYVLANVLTAYACEYGMAACLVLGVDRMSTRA